MATLTTLGIPAIDRRLNQLATREANKISRKALNRGLTVLARAERAAIDSAPGASPELQKALKKTVGKRLVLKGGPKIGAMAKAGLGVGQNPKTAKQKARKAEKVAKAKAAREGNKGVGVSANNAHWFALGTRDRYQGAPYDRTKGNKGKLRIKANTTAKFVGKIEPMDLIRKAAPSLGRVYTTVEAAARQGIETAVNALKNA